MKKIAVVLSGCGVFDGAEIHESVLSLLALEQGGAKAQCFAPDMAQAQVVDHITGKPVEQTRNVLAESARIARGAVLPLSRLCPADWDALLVPGGFGAAKNLCDFAFKGEAMRVLPELERIILAFYEAKKPMGFLCIAPVIAAKVLGAQGVELTIGDDPQTAAFIAHTGARHIPCPFDAFHWDKKCGVLSAPAYMKARSIDEARRSIFPLVAKLLELA